MASVWFKAIYLPYKLPISPFSGYQSLPREQNASNRMAGQFFYDFLQSSINTSLCHLWVTGQKKNCQVHEQLFNIFCYKTAKSLYQKISGLMAPNNTVFQRLKGQVLKLCNSKNVKSLTTLFVLPGLSTENLSWPFSRWASSITCHQMSLGTIPCTQVQQHIVIWHPGMTECSQRCDLNPELSVGGGGKEKEHR